MQDCELFPLMGRLALPDSEALYEHFGKPSNQTGNPTAGLINDVSSQQPISFKLIRALELCQPEKSLLITDRGFPFSNS